MASDVFVSYASEDKRFARSVAEGLRDAGYDVWFDAFSLEPGDSLRRSIDKGLRESRYGIVILSPNFFRKEWPQKELDGLVARDDGKSKVLIPVWYNVTLDDVRAFSPPLADKLAVYYGGSVKGVIAKLARAIERDAFRGATWTPQYVATPSGLPLALLPFKPLRSGRVLCMGRYAVTNAQYANFLAATGHLKPVGEQFVGDAWVGPFEPWRESPFAVKDAPVVCVSFWDALDFCLWASSESISVFLPTAEIWDLVAAEGQAGVTVRHARDRFDSNRVCRTSGAPASVTTSAQRENALGVADLFGNVWEWCGGNLREQDYAAIPIIGFRRRFRSMEAELRGGGFLDDLATVHPALRSGMLDDGLDTRHSDLGFRVCATVPKKLFSVGIRNLLRDLPNLPMSIRPIADDPTDAYMAFRYMRDEQRWTDEEGT